MSNEDFRALIDAAADDAKAKADAAVQQDLDAILAQATELEDIFDDVQLTDPAVYAHLTAVVRDATARNESIAAILDRLKASGQAGAQLASRIADITSGGAVAALRAALKGAASV